MEAASRDLEELQPFMIWAIFSTESEPLHNPIESDHVLFACIYLKLLCILTAMQRTGIDNQTHFRYLYWNASISFCTMRRFVSEIDII